MRFDVRDGGRTIVVKLTLRRSDGNKSVGGMVVIKKIVDFIEQYNGHLCFLGFEKEVRFPAFLDKGGYSASVEHREEIHKRAEKAKTQRQVEPALVFATPSMKHSPSP